MATSAHLTETVCRHELAAVAWGLAGTPGEALAASGSAQAVDERARNARDLSERARRAVDALANVIIFDPVLELKIVYALLMPSLAYAASALGARAETLGALVEHSEPNWEKLAGKPEPLRRPEHAPVAMREKLIDELRALARDCRAAAQGAPFAWDEATPAEALRLADTLEAAVARLVGLAAGYRNEPDPSPDAPLPARPAEFDIAPLGLPRTTGPKPADATAMSLHNFLFEAEFGGLELCAENILIGEGMPDEFVIDMAVQCYDEARHATALQARLPVYGAAPGSYPVSTKFWNRSRDLSLAQRLAVNQRIGEWIGVDSLIAGVGQYRALGDEVTAQLMQYMARDEIRHVGYGNKWLGWFEEQGQLSVEVIDRWADEYRASYGEDAGTAAASLPLNVAECVEAGFTLVEVDRLRVARESGAAALEARRAAAAVSRQGRI